MKRHCEINIGLAIGIASMAVACSGGENTIPAGVGGSVTAGGAPSMGGAVSTGGANQATGGANPIGGANPTGGASPTGGANPTGGKAATGGAPATGGASPTGGKAATGGAPTVGGKAATGGDLATGGSNPVGGKAGSGGGQATGGAAALGGKASTGGSSATGGQATAGNTGASGGANKSSGCGVATTLTSGNGKTITVGGTSRTYNLRIPDPYDMNKPHRLIVAYHWMNGTANNVTSDNYYGLWSLSAGSTIFVAPQGTGNRWSNSGGSDVEFSRTLIAQLESQLCIDTSRIFCEGFSMGGSMSYAMACAMPDKIRAVAVHSGGAMSGCVTHSKPVAYFMTHGINDSVCTYPGYGVPQLQDFAKQNKCTSPDPSLSATAFEAALPNPTNANASCIDFQGCTPGYPTRSCLFVGDHVYQSGNPNWIPGETWKFLSQF